VRPPGPQNFRGGGAKTSALEIKNIAGLVTHTIFFSSTVIELRAQAWQSGAPLLEPHSQPFSVLVIFQINS
jgi:hypothetical protein